MNMQITAQPFTSEAEYQREAKARARRLWAPRKAKQPEPVERKAEVVFLTQRAPAWEWADVHFDAHVMAFRAHRMTPYKFIRMLAEEEGLSYEVLISRKELRRLAPQRQAIIVKTAERFPRLSCLQLAALFKRDHSSILWTLGRTTRAKEHIAKATLNPVKTRQN